MVPSIFINPFFYSIFALIPTIVIVLAPIFELSPITVALLSILSCVSFIVGMLMFNMSNESVIAEQERLVKELQNKIKSIDEEVLEAVLLIGGDLQDHEMHDKIILASAMALQCPLISSDGALKKYNAAAHAVPEVFS